MPTPEQLNAVFEALISLAVTMDSACPCSYAGEGLPTSIDKAIFKTCSDIIKAGDALRALAYKVNGAPNGYA